MDEEYDQGADHLEVQVGVFRSTGSQDIKFIQGMHATKLLQDTRAESQCVGVTDSTKYESVIRDLNQRLLAATDAARHNLVIAQQAQTTHQKEIEQMQARHLAEMEKLQATHQAELEKVQMWATPGGHITGDTCSSMSQGSITGDTSSSMSHFVCIPPARLYEPS